MKRSIITYIAIIALLAAGMLVGGCLRVAHWHWAELLLWTAACGLAEFLWLQTISGQGTVSMASTFNLAVIFLFGWESSLVPIAISTLVANVAVQRKEWYKALFNVSQSVVTMAASGLVFAACGGHALLPPGGMSGASRVAEFATRFNDVRLFLPFLACGFVYQLVNTFLVSGVIGLASERPVLLVWRQNYGYFTEIVSSLALLALSPLVVLAYGVSSLVGLVLFFVPLFLIKEASQRYIDLEKAQDSLIQSERMAAQGEMAAEIGHELNNYLTAISGRAQLVLMKMPLEADPRLRAAAEIIFENTANMTGLTKGLMEAGRRETEPRPAQLNDVVRKTVEFVRPQNKFDNVKFETRLDDAIPMTHLDPAQIKQVLMNLFVNAADAMNDAGTPDKTIMVITHFDATRQQVILTVTDNGPGMNSEIAARIFEPKFTTKQYGHGFGLSTSFRIIENHSGRIAVTSKPGEGATFTVNLPLKKAA